MNTYSWYQQLLKPSWAPPSWLFGPVWTFCYLIITLTFGWVFLLVIQKHLPAFMALPFALNLLFNFAFTPIQFGLKNNSLAAVDILLVLATLIWAFLTIWPSAPWLVYANLPYFLWVLFATILQLTVTYLNRQPE